MQNTILIIDDNPGVGEALTLLLSLHDMHALVATDPEQGLAMLEQESVDLVIQDMNFSLDTTSGQEGTALFHRIRALHADLPVILLTAWTQLEHAVETHVKAPLPARKAPAEKPTAKKAPAKRAAAKKKTGEES